MEKYLLKFRGFITQLVIPILFIVFSIWAIFALRDCTLRSMSEVDYHVHKQMGEDGTTIYLIRRENAFTNPIVEGLEYRTLEEAEAHIENYYKGEG